MNSRRTFITSYIIISLFISFFCVVIIDDIKINDHNLKKVSAHIIEDDIVETSSSIKISYEVDKEKYQTRLTSIKGNGEYIDVYYNEKNPIEVYTSKKRYLKNNEKAFVYKILGIVFVLCSCGMALWFYHKFKGVSEEKEDKKKDHHISHIESKKIDSTRGIIVNGNIIDAVRVGENCSIGIEYEYKDEIYEFYIDGFPLEVIDKIINKKNINIKVYINSNHPELARVDEEKIRKILL